MRCGRFRLAPDESRPASRSFIATFVDDIHRVWEPPGPVGARLRPRRLLTTRSGPASTLVRVTHSHSHSHPWTVRPRSDRWPRRSSSDCWSPSASRSWPGPRCCGRASRRSRSRCRTRTPRAVRSPPRPGHVLSTGKADCGGADGRRGAHETTRHRPQARTPRASRRWWPSTPAPTRRQHGAGVQRRTRPAATRGRRPHPHQPAGRPDRHHDLLVLRLRAGVAADRAGRPCSRW